MKSNFLWLILIRVFADGIAQVLVILVPAFNEESHK